MGCRTRVYEDLFGERTSIGRGNLSFTTINLPRLAMECGKYKHKDFDNKIFEQRRKHLEIYLLKLSKMY